MWGWEREEEEKVQAYISPPLHLRGTVVYLYQEGYIPFGGLF